MIDADLVATLVASGRAALMPDFAHKILITTDGVQLDWLARDKALDLFYCRRSAKDIAAVLRGVLNTLPIDVIVQPVAQRKKQLLVADMESTIIEQEMLDELATMAGVGERVADITRRAMNGEIDFIAALQERAGLLKGLPAVVLEEAAERITLMPGAAELVATMRAHGAYTLIVTGGFTCFADKVMQRLVFDSFHANQLLTENNVIAGRIVEPVLDRHRKKKILDEVCAERHLEMSQVMAVGDGANDIPMLAGCNAGGGLGVAYRAKPVVRAAVQHQINHSDLKTLLFAQGYRDDEFICK